MARSLPSRPNLKHLQHEAKQLLRMHRQGNPVACDVLRFLDRFRNAAVQTILQSPLKLSDVQYAVALSYGSRSWRQLKASVKRPSSANGTGGETRRRYSYIGVDASRKLTEDVVIARDLSDALRQIGVRGRAALAIQRQDREPVSVTPGQAARHTVALLLLQALTTRGWTSLVFDLSRHQPRWRVLMMQRKGRWLPLPKEVSSLALLRLLQGMGCRKNAKGHQPTRRTLTIGQSLPDTRPHRVVLEFRAGSCRADRVELALVKPGSRRVFLYDRPALFRRILSLCRRNETLHVLTREEAQAREIADQLTERLGQDRVRMAASNGKVVPATPVIVSTVAGLCFAAIRAETRGEEERISFEERLGKTPCVLVNVDDEYALTPCHLVEPEGPLLGAMRIGELLMLYGRVREFRTKTG